MKYHNSFRKCTSAFTLIELLIVITIIAILAGIAFPVFNKVFGQAEEVQAQKDCSELATAVTSFFNDTHRYPVPQSEQTGEDIQKRSDAEFIAHLNGSDDTVNRKKTPYFNGKEGKGDRGGLIREGEGWKYMDPWARMYYIDMDTSRDERVESPYESGLYKFIPALVYSYGPDGSLDTKEDNVKSW